MVFNIFILDVNTNLMHLKKGGERRWMKAMTRIKIS